jgi:lipopolysaccharide export system protein LptA
MTRMLIVAAAVLLAIAVPAGAADVAFGGIKADTTLPVEVVSDSLSVDQADGSATFSGNVVIAQGEMRLSAAEVRIEYADGDRTRIERLFATGGVTLVSGTEAVEAREALYTIETGVIVLTGDVLLTQGANTLTGQELTVDLKTGTGRMEGRVKTVLQPGGN